ncbi:MAG: 4Fe-4S dicluster domain-containing protein [Candidatus Melainabacteria bacterium]
MMPVDSKVRYKSPHPPALSPAQARMTAALAQKRFFKLIAGGSLTDAPAVAALCHVYALAGADCVDIAPDPAVLAAVANAWRALPPETGRPVVMVSLPLDADPHFRKIELRSDDCILCGLCEPVCPTHAIAMPDHTGSDAMLSIHQPGCYGCNRCVEICPTDALVLHPFRVESQLRAVLAHPLVEAVEIHTGFADPYMLPGFLSQYGDLLRGKLVALCFRPEDADGQPALPPAQWLTFIRQLEAALDFPLILQIDGRPMSATADPQASLPALQAARRVLAILATADEPGRLVTISGGINSHTARWLNTPQYAAIAGAGLGTFARQWVWTDLFEPQGAASGAVGRFEPVLKKAAALVDTFHTRA